MVDQRVLDRAAAEQRRRREREAVASAPDRDRPRLALLEDDVARARVATRLEPRVAGAERRMPGERQLRHRGKDPHAVVGRRRRQDERRLGEVRPVREALHCLRGEPRRTEHDRHRVAQEGGRGEDVDLGERPRHPRRTLDGGRDRLQPRTVSREVACNSGRDGYRGGRIAEARAAPVPLTDPLAVAARGVRSPFGLRGGALRVRRHAGPRAERTLLSRPQLFLSNVGRKGRGWRRWPARDVASVVVAAG